ncbi:hypothetical protein IAU59_006448 [Kwoniella sp. CBS 9459]
MTHAPFAMYNNNAMPSSSAFKAKRKRMSWGMDEEESAKHIRVRSPTMQHSYPLPELMTDHSNSASDDDQAMDQDMDMNDDVNVHMAMGMSASHADTHDHHGQDNGYVFSSGGSGGFGFGPGAEEDELELEMMDDMGAGAMKSAFPSSYGSLTPHPNPHHFSNPHYQTSLSSHPNGHLHNGNANFPAYNSQRATSPLAAQAFSTSLPAPAGAARGLMQPAYAGPVPVGANEVEKARMQHGPGCKSIPKLVLSEYPDPTTGRRSMWSLCNDCGACEMAQ